jgi:carbon catabolite-derepressing protein kinase
MTSALDDEDLALSINLSHTRRNSNRGDDLRSDDSVSAPGGSVYGDSQFARETTSSTTTTSLQQRLNQYTILRTLGEGSFGKVKLAIHKTSGQKVALKIINRKKLMARDMQGRTEREIQYLQLLRHPHIIKL